MEAEGGEAGHPANMPKALAFYLPQFHPIPENDEWWGMGFTEWTNVMRARPLFPGHYQPHVPGELGYYDLRVPEVRAAQAELARSHGIAGFVYYHYWFNGQQLLERPFDEVLASGQPDFPFALCWANEEWTRNWDAESGTVLMPQEYSDADDLAHIRWLATAFADDRYIKIDGRPLMLVYRVPELPDPKRTADTWRTEAQRLGYPDLYLCWVESRGRPQGGPEQFGMDATVGFRPHHPEQVQLPVRTARGHHLYDYPDSARREMERLVTPWKRFPSVMVQWDNTARRPVGASIFCDATPDVYQHWLGYTAASVATVRPEENYVFVVAWNEWAEGNHLEPDERYGRAFLEATRAVLLDSKPVDLVDFKARPRSNEVATRRQAGFQYVYPYRHEGSLANVAGLVRDIVSDPAETVVDLGAGTGVIAPVLKESGLRYHGFDVHERAIRLLHESGISATECDLRDLDAVPRALGQVEPVGAFLLLDVIEHLTDPHLLLSALSDWAIKHGEPGLVVSVPNITHFDVGFRLLCGQWNMTETGLLDSTHLRFFTAASLERMLARCGWQIVARDDFEAVRTDQYDPQLNDGTPAEMVGALRVLAESYNPDSAVKQFVWALKPVRVEDPPLTFLEAVGAPEVAVGGESEAGDPTSDGSLRAYLDSIGILTSEIRRRSQVPAPTGQRDRVPAFARSSALPRWKRTALAVVYSIPGLRELFERHYSK
ncbi:MAG: glycoside hydrolase family 99-like domain-containing protein [Acidimicrobiales bacterium]